MYFWCLCFGYMWCDQWCRGAFFLKKYGRVIIGLTLLLYFASDFVELNIIKNDVIERAKTFSQYHMPRTIYFLTIWWISPGIWLWIRCDIRMGMKHFFTIKEKKYADVRIKFPSRKSMHISVKFGAMLKMRRSDGAMSLWPLTSASASHTGSQVTVRSQFVIPQYPQHLYVGVSWTS